MSAPGELKVLTTALASIGIPAGQAAVSGVTAFAIALSLAWYFESDKPLVIAFLAGGVVFGLAWIGGIAWWRNRITGAKAKELPAQINQAITRVEVIAQDPSGAFLAGAWADLPVDTHKLIKMARRVADGASFSHADLAGNHRPLSRSEFEELRSEFLRRGLASWVDPSCHNRGTQLTRAGAAVMRRLAEETDDPPTTHSAKIIPRKLLDAGGLHTHTYTHGQFTGEK